VAAEMFAGGPETPVDELSPWERGALGTPDDLPGIVAHEAAHCQQPPLSRSAPLLDHVLREGAADFVASLVAPPSAAARARHAWGDAHEAALWDEFRRDLLAASPARWLFQGQDAGRPADLGYYLGYRICQAYYRRAADPVVAVRRILTHTDAQALLRDSGYAGAGHPGMEVRRAPEPTPHTAR
jgi:uncharacterized protein YjaZ